MYVQMKESATAMFCLKKRGEIESETEFIEIFARLRAEKLS